MTESRFRLVRKGYEPTEVDRIVAELSSRLERSLADLAKARDESASHVVENAKLRQQGEDLMTRMKMLEQTLAEERAEQASTLPPSYAALGERLGQMLQLASDEADDLRAAATDEIEAMHDENRAHCDALIADAKTEAADLVSRGQTEATRILEVARQQADQILEDSQSEANARMEEAEAVYEAQRAQAAQSAVEFEQNLAARREQATKELNDELHKLSEQVRLAETRLTETRSEADQTIREARTNADNMVREAKNRADSLLSEAKIRADGIRQNSERELAAATARRDSITAQLANVRQMLATLGGPTMAPANPLTAQDWSEAIPGEDGANSEGGHQDRM